MFRSATLKLTAWYLVIIMAVSLIFSFTIYQLNFREVNVRLENLQHGLVTRKVSMSVSTVSPQDRLRLDQSEGAAAQMTLVLVYINALILILGGLGSYLLARRTLEPIEKAHEAQSRFTSDASHELRTPLAAMKAELEVYLRDDALTLAEAKELLESNLEEVEKLTKLSDMLLKMSRLDYDKLEKTQIDIVNLLPVAMKSFSKSKKRFDITTRKHAFVTGNEAAVSELMSILIENSLKYSPARSRISIRIFEKRMMIGFEVRNTGNPIREDDLPHIFDRFYRADSSRTSSGTNGYGLGLAIAKRITEIHHGYIHVLLTKYKKYNS
jgi:two-component system sensor histidine kinase CiaH